MSHEERQLRRKFPKGLTPPKLAVLVGVSARTIERRIDAAELPFKDNGPKKRLVEWNVIDLLQRHGLGGVGRMMAAGRL